MTVAGPFTFDGGCIGPPVTFMHDLPSNMYVDAQNVQFDNDSLVKRKGSVIMTAGNHPGASSINLLDEYVTAGGAATFFLGYGGTKIAYYASSQWNDITGAASLLTNRKANSFVLNGIWVITTVGASYVPYKWTGTGNIALLGGTPPGCVCGATAYSTAFLANSVSTNTSRVFWSAVNDPETWPVANYVDFRLDAGDYIVALAPMDDYLIIFKSRSIGKLWLGGQGSTFGPLTTVSEKVGLADLKAWDRLPDGRIIFMGNDSHAYTYDGSALTDISHRPSPKSSMSFGNLFSFIPITNTKAATVFQYKGINGIQRNQVWFCYEDGTTSRVIYVYDWMRDIWIGKFAGTTVWSAKVRNSDNYLYTGGNPNLVQQDYGYTLNDDAALTDFKAYVTKSVNLSPGKRDFNVVSALMPVYSVNQNVSFSFTGTLYYDWNWPSYQLSGANKTYTFIMPSIGYSRKTIPISGTGNSGNISIQFINIYQGQYFQLEPFYLSDEVLT